MARKHYIVPTAPVESSTTARLGSAAGSANNLSYLDEGKLVKLAGDSQYNLCAAGDEIEGIITSVESATQDQWSIGGVNIKFERIFAIADGLQATPGTGTLAVGDYVVAGTITAKGTALTTYPKVCKATGAGTTLNHKFRVVSLFTGGVGTVGATIVIQRVA